MGPASGPVGDYSLKPASMAGAAVQSLLCAVQPLLLRARPRALRGGARALHGTRRAGEPPAPEAARCPPGGGATLNLARAGAAQLASPEDLDKLLTEEMVEEFITSK